MIDAQVAQRAPDTFSLTSKTESRLIAISDYCDAVRMIAETVDSEPARRLGAIHGLAVAMMRDIDDALAGLNALHLIHHQRTEKAA